MSKLGALGGSGRKNPPPPAPLRMRDLMHHLRAIEDCADEEEAPIACLPVKTPRSNRKRGTPTPRKVRPFSTKKFTPSAASAQNAQNLHAKETRKCLIFSGGTPQSSNLTNLTNLSSNSILREYREKEVADLDSFPRRGSSFSKRTRTPLFKPPPVPAVDNKENADPEPPTVEDVLNMSFEITAITGSPSKKTEPTVKSSNFLNQEKTNTHPSLCGKDLPKPQIAQIGQISQIAQNSQNTQFETMTVKGKSYTVLGKLGSGGSSDVYKVMDPADSSTFAIKCVNMAVDASTADSYINELNHLQRLQGSDRVITMYSYEYIKQQRKLYVLLEMGDVDLSNLLKSYRAKGKFLPYPILIGYWTEMLTAVNHIHKNGIIHSDLKPANFLLVHGRLKLIDFGIASSINADATSVMKKSTAGTLNYISPEAITMNSANDTAKISYRSDVWSLGCILYSMLYGYTPFSHVKHMYAKIAMLSNPNQRIEYPAKDVPPVVMKALQWCLTFDIKKRPSVQELIDLPYINVSNMARPCEDIPLSIVMKIKSALTEEEWQLLAKAMGAN